ncbi:MAG: SpoIIE family protein phosphatase [Chloroflexia bacterium]|nr:SpoIIE family protein phosphatase [Chloroflexia bacterium]
MDNAGSAQELYFLYQLAKSLALSIDLDEVMEYVIDGTCALLGAEQGFCCFLDHAGRLRPHTARGLQAADLDALARPFQGALDERRPIACAHPQSAQGAVLAAPLLVRNQVQGLLGVATVYERQFSPVEQKRLTNVANLAALALDNARLYERVQQELALGWQIQQSFLPTSWPALPHTDLAVFCRPAREVGGDFYDVVPLPDGCLGLVMADVSDKGVPAALFMALTRSLLRAYAPQQSVPSQVLHQVNEFLVRDAGVSNMFVTLFYAIWDPQRRRLCCANAGHNLPLLCRREGDLEILPPGGLALGVMPQQRWPEVELLLRPGDVLVTYTDGLTEARNSARDIFGDERLRQLLQPPLSPSAEGVLQHLVRAVDDFCGDTPAADDLTLLILRCAEKGED